MDAVARHEAEAEDRKVTVLSALDYQRWDKNKIKKKSKSKNDVLDLIFHQKYRDTGITFHSLADLRRARGESSSNYHILVYSLL